MGGVAKPLLALDGIPLVQHVIDRIRPQVSSLVLSVARENPDLRPFRVEQVMDPVPGCGPLGGLLAALAHMPAGSEWLLLVPCDAPFLSHDLASRLVNKAMSANAPACVANLGTELQPTFSVWRRSLMPELQQAVLSDGLGGFKQFLGRVPYATLDCEPAESGSFFNINTPRDLEQAEELIGRARSAQLGSQG